MNTLYLKIFEILFNISYLVVIWFYLIKMFKSHETSQLMTFFKKAFLWLAIGDTFHVGLRVVAHLLGDINYRLMFFNSPVKLVGVGALLTAITVTITYVYFSKAWYHTYNRHHLIYKLILGLSALRVIIVLLPQNKWFTQSPYSWALIRNLPLLLIGILLVRVLYTDSRIDQNAFFKTLAHLIVWSYVFYLPVILFVNKVPMLGMLMIPKTIMYLLMLRLFYKTYHIKKAT